MGLVDSIRVLNNLKRRRIIRDYVLIGGVAATAYMEPVFTEDLDVVVMVDTDEEYLHLFQAVSSYPMAWMERITSSVASQFKYFPLP